MPIQKISSFSMTVTRPSGVVGVATIAVSSARVRERSQASKRQEHKSDGFLHGFLPLVGGSAKVITP